MCGAAGCAHLLAGVQGEEQRCEAGGGVPAMVLRPVLMDVLEEGWAQDQHLIGVRGVISCNQDSQLLSPLWTTVPQLCLHPTCLPTE